MVSNYCTHYTDSALILTSSSQFKRGRHLSIRRSWWTLDGRWRISFSNIANKLQFISCPVFQAQTGTLGALRPRAAMMFGSHGAVQRETEVWRGATIAAPQKEAQTGVQTGTATKATGEENPPATPPTTGEAAMGSETAETEVSKGAFNSTLQEFTILCLHCLRGNKSSS